MISIDLEPIVLDQAKSILLSDNLVRNPNRTRQPELSARDRHPAGREKRLEAVTFSLV